LTAPSDPEAGLHRLPATLRIQVQIPMAGCSKAPGVFSSCRRYRASSLGLDFHRAPGRDSAPVVTPFMHSGTYPERNYATFEPSELGLTLTGASTGKHSVTEFLDPAHYTSSFNLPASVRRHPLYIPFWGLQGAVFLVNSRQGNIRCAPIYIGEALSRSYDRLFAEFLGQESPIGLGTLAPAHLCWFAVRAPCL